MAGSRCTDRSTEASLPGTVASGFAESGDLCVFYEVHGEGDPLVLVHGWSLSVKTGWGDTGWIDALMADHQVVALDVRGHGNSDKPRTQELYSYELMAADVLAVMDELGIEKAGYVGYSLGGFAGAYLLGHHSERFSSAVFLGTGDEPPETAASGGQVAEALRAADPSTLDGETAF
jgi:pimeloyl-ACP methyl ester carboxylesterase